MVRAGVASTDGGRGGCLVCLVRCEARPVNSRPVLAADTHPRPIRLRISMNSVGSLVTASVVAAVLWQAGSLSDGAAGLTLSYATQFTQAVMWMFRAS